ncbi:hypothetical protein BGW42_002894, partial [Actinomortierella wolfii]
MQTSESLLVLGNLLGLGTFGSVYEARWGCQQCAAKAFLLTQSDLLPKGGTLAKAIHKGLLDWQDKTRLAHEIARGLEYIHQEDVLHRDLKSANVLLTRHMEAKLADFGLSWIRSTVSSSDLSMPSAAGGRLTGTLGWIASELFETDRPPYSTKSDIYALGMVMWEMAANCTRPFKDQDNLALVVQHVKRGGRERLPDDTPDEYREWVERCWHHDPGQRPDASKVILEHGQQVEADDDSDAVSISLTFSDQEITHVDTDGRPIVVSHHLDSAIAMASGRLPQTDDDVNVEDSAWWYRKAAERGNATAQFMLGEIYENGHGVDASDVEAATWYRSAAVHGVDKAQIKLGGMYEDGRGVQQDDVEAVRWYLMAANQGQDGAQIKIAWMYTEGHGVRQSDAEAIKWYTKAAEQGNATAQNNLGRLYKEGQGVEQSDIEAVKWLTKAVMQGIAAAQRNLAWMYREGRGVEQSDVEAAK